MQLLNFVWKEGATVVITGRNKERLDQAESDLLENFIFSIAHNVDVSNESELQSH